MGLYALSSTSSPNNAKRTHRSTLGLRPRLIVSWAVFCNNWANAESISGYYAGENRFNQDPVSFLGWGLRDRDHAVSRTSKQDELKYSPADESFRQITLTEIKSQTSKTDELPKTGAHEILKSPEKRLPLMPMSPEVEQKIQTGPTVVIEGATIHYIPLDQMVTSDPFMFPVANYIYHPNGVLHPNMLPSYRLQPNLVVADNIYPQTNYQQGMFQQRMPFPPQLMVPQSAYFRATYKTNPTEAYTLKNNANVCDEEVAEEPQLQLPKQEHTAPFTNIKKENLHKDLLGPPRSKIETGEASRHTLFVHPGLVDLMKAMDHSLLSFPSRFDYRPVQTAQPSLNLPVYYA